MVDLEGLFHPRSVAVVGASADPSKQGHTFVSALLEQGFPGPIYPVNPRQREVLGLPCYPSLEEVPGPVDYVICAIPAAETPGLIEQAGRKGVRAVHLFTARFSETGRGEARALERELVERARRAGVRLLGPNCMGLYVPSAGLAFKTGMPRQPGDVAFVSQSGGYALEMVLDASLRGARFSKVVSYGNAADLNECDFLDYLAEDPQTRVITLYIEGVRDGRRFFRSLQRAASRKPVALLKGGRTGAGARAAVSHTASLAGRERLWSALCRQAGVVQVHSLQELADMALAFSLLPPARGLRVGVAGGGGGHAVTSADACEEEGLEVVPLPASVRRRLREMEPLVADWVGNPVDGSILFGTRVSTPQVLGLMAEDPAFDLLITTLEEAFLLERPEGVPLVRGYLDGLLQVARRRLKPQVHVLGALAPHHRWQEEALAELRRMCVEAGVPTFPSVSRAARALRRMVWYYNNREEV